MPETIQKRNNKNVFGGLVLFSRSLKSNNKDQRDLFSSNAVWLRASSLNSPKEVIIIKTNGAKYLPAFHCAIVKVVTRLN
jgi:hypothetical protein